MNKKERLLAIQNILSGNKIENQEELLNTLKSKGFNITQATLSRDVKFLKIIKVPDESGNYIYTLPTDNYLSISSSANDKSSLASIGVITLEFSGNLAIIKTRPGYAMAIASDIDKRATKTILGTIAGDDTVLLVPREGFSREEITASLSSFIPNIQIRL